MESSNFAKIHMLSLRAAIVGLLFGAVLLPMWLFFFAIAHIDNIGIGLFLLLIYSLFSLFTAYGQMTAALNQQHSNYQQQLDQWSQQDFSPVALAGLPLWLALLYGFFRGLSYAPLTANLHIYLRDKATQPAQMPAQMAPIYMQHNQPQLRHHAQMLTYHRSPE